MDAKKKLTPDDIRGGNLASLLQPGLEGGIAPLTLNQNVSID
jgi:hypothetical protein